MEENVEILKSLDGGTEGQRLQSCNVTIKVAFKLIILTF